MLAILLCPELKQLNFSGFIELYIIYVPNILITIYVTGIAEETLYDWMKRQQSEKHLLENGEVIVDPDNDEIVTIKIKVIETKN